MPKVTPIAQVRAILDAANPAAASAALEVLNLSSYLTTVDPVGATAGSIRIATSKLATGSVPPTTMGANSIDLQMVRGSALSGANSVAFGISNTASGGKSVALGDTNTASATNAIAIGSFNTVSGQFSAVAMGVLNTSSGLSSVALGSGNTASGGRAFAMGCNNTASGDQSLALGMSSIASRMCQLSVASENFATAGDAQSTRLVAKASTTGTTAATMLLDGSPIAITSGTLFACTIQIAGIKNGGGKVAHYVRKILAQNIAGTATLLSETTLGTDVETDAAWGVVITCASGNLVITVTGAAGDTVRWVASIDGLEIGIG